jgi:hypothetical protein
MTVVVIAAAGLLVWFLVFRPPQATAFDADRAYQDVFLQVEMGPRTPDSLGQERLLEWLEDELAGAGWQVQRQELVFRGFPIVNVVARRGASDLPWLLLGAHYDTRLRADQETTTGAQSMPVPGANDGAAAVAVLVELARVLPDDLPFGIQLVFFDAEDNGDIEGRDWAMGSQAYVAQLAGHPQAAVIIDMIGDADLNVFMEQNSDPGLTGSIWAQAASLGHAEQIVALPRYAMLDDHRPFLEAGIPAALLIDFDYPYWHTLADTPDKVSAESLQVIGDTLLAWLMAYQP